MKYPAAVVKEAIGYCVARDAWCKTDRTAPVPAVSLEAKALADVAWSHTQELWYVARQKAGADFSTDGVGTHWLGAAKLLRKGWRPTVATYKTYGYVDPMKKATDALTEFVTQAEASINASYDAEAPFVTMISVPGVKDTFALLAIIRTVSKTKSKRAATDALAPLIKKFSKLAKGGGFDSAAVHAALNKASKKSKPKT